MENKRSQASLAQLQRQYQSRITIAKQGQECVQKNDLKNAIKYYNQYLKLLSEINNIEPHHLSPKYFDPKSQGAEIFLISQIYWDLAKIYDLAPNLKKEFIHSLNKFAEFSLNFPFQVVNAETLRRFIRRGKCKNLSDFQETYKKISIASKMCFVATNTFGDTDIRTNIFRSFKPLLAQNSLGLSFIEQYYHYSPKLLGWFERHPKMANFFTYYLIRPFLTLLAKFLEPHILK
jgi:hypothetical protein